MRAKLLEAVPATEVRVARGEVATAEVAVLNDQGRVTGRAKQYRVQDQLTRYCNLKALNQHQWLAGRRFARDAEGAIVGVASQLGRDATGGDGLSALLRQGIVAAGASMRLRRAILAMGDHAAVVIFVAAHGRSAHEFAELRGEAPPSGIMQLRRGLDRLVRHYGLDRTDGARS